MHLVGQDLRQKGDFAAIINVEGQLRMPGGRLFIIYYSGLIRLITVVGYVACFNQAFPVPAESTGKDRGNDSLDRWRFLKTIPLL